MSRGMGISNPMWFVGVVENNDDPTKQGRVQVRAFGVHGENTDEEIPTGALPWAVCVAGNYEPNNPPPKLNSFVFGMFLDGDEAQHPMIMGLIPAQYTEKHDPDKDKWGVVPGDDAPLRAQGLDPESFGMTQMSRLGRAEDLDATYITPQFSNAITKQKIADSELTWDEPPPAYGAKYPHNRVIETARHSIEIDDTPGAERIHIHHMSGSYIEIDATGAVKERADGDRYEVTIGTKHESSAHNVVTINGNSHVYIKGNKTEEIMGDYKQIVHGEHELSIGGSSFYNVGNHFNMRGANIKLEGNADRVTIFGKNEVQIEAEKQINSVALNIKNTALNTFDIYSNKAIKLLSPMDIHLVASNIINTAAGLIPPTPLSGTTGTPLQAGWSLTTPSMIVAAANGSFSGLWNAGAVNTAALLATTLSATTGNFGTLNTSILAAPLPISSAPGSICAPGGGRIVGITAPTVTIPIIQVPLVSNPIAAPLPGITSGWAYPTGNGPLFIAAVLTSPFSVLTGINPLPGGGLGLPRIQMPEPASYAKTIVPKGYFALGYALGFVSPLDDSADGDFNG